MTSRARAAVAVAAVAVLAGIPSLDAGFVHDDHRLIEQNELIRDPGNTARIFTQGYWTVDATAVPNLYRPVTILSFALNRALLGAGPAGFRAVNLLLHAGASVLVLLLALRLTAAGGPVGRVDGGSTQDGGRPLGWFETAPLAALLFAVHPVHTEALGLVVGRAEILAAIGAIGSVILFLEARARAARGHPGGARRADAAALCAFAFGFLAKENAVVTPLLVLLADAWRLAAAHLAAARVAAAPPADRPAWGAHAAFGALLAALLAARTAVLGMVSPAAFTHFIDNPIAHLPFPEATATALGVVVRYARLLVAPVGLCLEYSYDAIAPIRSLVAPGALAGAGIAAGILAGAALLRRTRPAAAFGLGFMAVAFAPVSNLLIPIGTIMAERLLYLPSAGFVVVAAGVAAAAATLGGFPGRAARAAIGAGLCAGIVLSGVRLRDFHDDLRLQEKTVAAAPRSVRAQFNYGAAAERAGDDAAAERAYREAIAIWPDFADAQYNLGGLLARRGRVDEALQHYREALRLQPGSVSYLVNYGAALARAGRPQEAIEPLERAVGIDAASDRAWNNLGVALLQTGRAAEAARAWREAIRLAPDNAEYVVNLALALDAAGDPGAAPAWQDAVTRRPGDGILLYRLGRALERAGREEEAIAAYRESARITPTSPVPRRALGLLLDRRGDADSARAALEDAERLDQGAGVFDAEARRVLERLRAASGSPAAGN